LELKAAVEKESKKSKKRQATSDPDLPTTTDKVDSGKNYIILNCLLARANFLHLIWLGYLCVLDPIFLVFCSH